MKRLLFTPVDNSSLILFRICFGVLIALESFGAIATGWVNENLIEPQFTFTFIGFEWLQPLPGTGMYFYFGIMGLLGIAVALGYRYRLSMILFTLLWTGAYFMQKTAYNNHYYLLVLLSGFMCFFPANRAVSLDVKRNAAHKQHYMYSWVSCLIIAQLWIVYTFAAIAKCYPDWLDLGFVSELMAPKLHYPILGELLQLPWVLRIVVWFGVCYDFVVIPLMLWKPTRNFAFAASVFFHLFNAITLHIGIFPFLSLALMVFFFEPETIRQRFFPKKPKCNKVQTVATHPHFGTALILLVYLGVQIILPLRHHLLKGDVLWTEEGHRLSWRMMLRNRQGIAQFRVVDKNTRENEPINLDHYLTPKQKEKVMALPDFMWQFAQYLEQVYAAQGKEIEVYVRSRVRVNNRPFYPFTDETVDLAAAAWEPLVPTTWILPPPSDWPYTEKIKLTLPE
ncbi:MAG: hypothetical protein RLZZ241_871 [Bacteroidota bacterium]